MKSLRLVALLLALVGIAAPASGQGIYLPPNGVTVVINPGPTVDSSARVQAALNAASPGQTVLLPSGYWLWNSAVTIPSGVKLQGGNNWSIPAYNLQSGISNTNPTTYGTVIGLNWSGSGTTSASTPFVTMGQNSTLEGVALYDPTQGIPGGAGGIARPYFVGVNYGSGTGGNNFIANSGVTIRRVSIVNATQAIRLWGALRFTVQDVVICASNQGIWVDQTWDTSLIDNVHMIPGWQTDGLGNSGAATYIAANLVAYRVDHADDLHIRDSMVYLCQTGLYLGQSSQSTNPIKPWITCSNLTIDVADVGVDCYYSQAQGVKFTNLCVTTPASSTNNIALRVASTAGPVLVSNSYLCSQTGKEVRIAGGQVSLQGCTINSIGNAPTGTSASILVSAAATVNVGGNMFSDARPPVSYQATTGSLNYHGNTNPGAQAVVDPNSKVTSSGNN